MIRIELDSVRQARNKGEWRTGAKGISPPIALLLLGYVYQEWMPLLPKEKEQ